MKQQFDIDEKEILFISAKSGLGVPAVLEQVIKRIRMPFEDSERRATEPLKAFLFDAKYIPNRGVQCLVKIMDGNINTQFLRHLMSYHR